VLFLLLKTGLQMRCRITEEIKNQKKEKGESKGNVATR
jgi:hypothetical protein